MHCQREMKWHIVRKETNSIFYNASQIATIHRHVGTISPTEASRESPNSLSTFSISAHVAIPASIVFRVAIAVVAVIVYPPSRLNVHNPLTQWCNSSHIPAEPQAQALAPSLGRHLTFQFHMQRFVRKSAMSSISTWMSMFMVMKKTESSNQNLGLTRTLHPQP